MNTRIQNIPSSLALEAQSESFVVSRGSLLNLHSSVLSTIVPRFIEIIVDPAPRGMRRKAEGVWSRGWSKSWSRSWSQDTGWNARKKRSRIPRAEGSTGGLQRVGADVLLHSKSDYAETIYYTDFFKF